MKRKYLLLFGIGLLCVASCQKFLDADLQNHPTTASDPHLATNLVTGMYNDLLSGDTWGAGNDVHGFSFIAATNIISDDADKGSTAIDQPGIGDFDNFTLTSTSVFCNSLWQGYYAAIGDANNVLKYVPPAKLDTVLKTQYMAEARFLRGYYYFNLVRMFGDVPEVLRVPTGAQDATTAPEFSTRVSASSIYTDVIIPDLQYAADNLPAKAGAVIGRANKGAAQAFLAKVYLYRKDWQKAYDMSLAVINSGQYQLVSDFSMLWRPEGNNCVESIFEIQTGVYANTDLGIQLYSECQGPRVGGAGGWTDLGWGFCTPTPSLVNAYETGDKRKDATIITIDNSGAHAGTYLWDGFRVPSSDSVQNLFYNYKAYNSEIKAVNTIYAGNRDFKQKNIKLMRYADVLLINAEAANELGKTAEAINNLNAIRTRAGLANTTATDLRTAIWNERHVELALEHDRFWDIVRTGRAAQVMLAAGKNFVAGKNELLPVPEQQIQLSNGKLTQNNGY